eukprot:TRINITY_DN111198_c0_g1_i1.p2 TRINITY_DN111198_c0_g1~~TRINITY_DN111198_c0_g1_i1.p2  ORF type:complete len:220 (-),score=8.44 TRINITY_DN111198_c0_g1_i1:76-654(-)
MFDVVDPMAPRRWCPPWFRDLTAAGALLLIRAAHAQWPQDDHVVAWGPYIVQSENWFNNACPEGSEQILTQPECETALELYMELCPTTSLMQGSNGCAVIRQTWGGPAGCILRRTSTCFKGGRIGVEFNPNMNGVETLCNIAPICKLQNETESLCNVADIPSPDDNCSSARRFTLGLLTLLATAVATAWQQC